MMYTYFNFKCFFLFHLPHHPKIDYSFNANPKMEPFTPKYPSDRLPSILSSSNNTINYVTTTKKNCQFRQNLKNVLLAINFNHPFYDNIPTLKKFYEPHFGKVVFCGFKSNSTYNVIKMNHGAGMQGYHCLALAIKKYSNLQQKFEGYFYSNDDVILNFWNLNFDLDKVWLGTPVKWHHVHQRGRPAPTNWIWWASGAPRCEKVFHILKNMSITGDTSSLSNNSMDGVNLREKLKKHLQIYYENSHRREICMMSWSDAFYVPKKHAGFYAFLANIFEKELVFLEIASPTILHILTGPNGLYQMHGKYHADPELKHGTESFFKTYTFDIIFSHPFKLSSIANKKFFDLAIVPHAFEVVNQCNVNGLV